MEQAQRRHPVIYMSELYWFKNKRFGCGWYPATWQGWSLTMCLVLSSFGIVQFREQLKLTSELDVLLPIGALVIAYMVVVWRTGEPLACSWKSLNGRNHEN